MGIPIGEDRDLTLIPAIWNSIQTYLKHRVPHMWSMFGMTHGSPGLYHDHEYFDLLAL